MHDAADPRQSIRNMIADGDLDGCLRRAAEVHGHICPYLAAGVKATVLASRRLGILASGGMEKVLAIVECNNCFVDGIQAISGCTFANNALIYRDLGKTAVTFLRREAGEGLRLLLRDLAPLQETWEHRAEADRLFEKAVRRRRPLTDEEGRRFRALWEEAGFRVLHADEEALFRLQTVAVPAPPYAPILDSVQCAECGEDVMESHARLRDGQGVCLACAGERAWRVDGRGIHPEP